MPIRKDGQRSCTLWFDLIHHLIDSDVGPGLTYLVDFAVFQWLPFTANINLLHFLMHLISDFDRVLELFLFHTLNHMQLQFNLGYI